MKNREVVTLPFPESTKNKPLNNKAMVFEDFDYTDPQRLRKKAEEILRLKKEKAAHENLKIDAKKLLHELQVHQIELEMQNEELRLAIETAEEALKKYTLLFDQAPVGFFTLEPDGTISELNFTAAEILDEKRFSLLGSNFKLFVSDESKPVFSKFFSEVFKSKKKETCEVKLGYDKKSLCLAHIEGIAVDEDQKCQLSVVDITSFKNTP